MEAAGLQAAPSSAEQRKKEKAGRGAPLADPMAVEVLKAQAAAKCAEQFKVGRMARSSHGEAAPMGKHLGRAKVRVGFKDEGEG